MNPYRRVEFRGYIWNNLFLFELKSTVHYLNISGKYQLIGKNFYFCFWFFFFDRSRINSFQTCRIIPRIFSIGDSSAWCIHATTAMRLYTPIQRESAGQKFENMYVRWGTDDACKIYKQRWGPVTQVDEKDISTCDESFFEYFLSLFSYSSYPE